MRLKQKIKVSILMVILLMFSPFAIEKAMATAEQQVEDEEAEVNLELPDIYENTIIYNGTINPALTLSVRLPEFVVGEAGTEGLETPYVNDDGQFAMTFITEELVAGDEISFELSAEAMESNSQVIEVLPAEEGMEIVESSADTSTVQSSIIEATHFDWQEQEEAIILDIETVGDIESAPYYVVNDETISDERRAEHIQENLFRARFSTESINIGDIITFYVVASGVTTPVEVEVPDSINVLQSGNEEEPVEDETPSDSETEGPNGDIEDQDDTSDIENHDETQSSEVEGIEEEDEGISTGWIIGGIALVIVILGGIYYLIQKRRN